MVLYALNAIPSVTYGIFGLIFFVNILGTGLSWFVGSLILAIMMLPTVTIASHAAMQALPSGYSENASALGLSKGEIVRQVTLPQSARSLFEPVATLPTHILALAQQSTDPEALQNAWGASLTLVSFVALFSALAFMARRCRTSALITGKIAFYLMLALIFPRAALPASSGHRARVSRH